MRIVSVSLNEHAGLGLFVDPFPEHQTQMQAEERQQGAR
jgi:hypothetical protein